MIGIIRFYREFKQFMRFRKQEMQVRNLAVGMNSTVDMLEDRHIIMLDYDNVSLERVKESIRELQLFWGLADADIFETRNGFHAFFWYDQVPYDRLKMVVAYAKDVDPMYKYIGQYYDHKTIRVAGKYKERDIRFVERLAGIRAETKHEREIGEMKRKEHMHLRGSEDQYISAVSEE